MKNALFAQIFLTFLIISVYAVLISADDNLVLVQKGTTSELNGSIDMDYDFYISATEITQAKYKEIMGYNPSHFVGDNLPVESITWFDAVYFCNEKSKREKLKPYYSISRIRRRGKTIVEANVEERGGKGYRLPTSTEWEYAARGGMYGLPTPYSGSKDLYEVGWFLGVSEESTQPVGTKEPNEIGIYDMSGNVFEWTSTQRQEGRIVRGGSWDYYPHQCEVSFLHVVEPYIVQNSLGFRIARNP